MLELCPCPECGLPAEVVSDVTTLAEAAGSVPGTTTGEAGPVGRFVGVRCIERHWFYGLRERLVA